MNDRIRNSNPFVAELSDAQKKGVYVSVMMKGTFKYVSGKVEKVGDVLTKLKNDKGHVVIVNDDIRMLMTYESGE